MNRFVLFLKRIYPFVMFIVIQALAINYYVNNSTSYNKARSLAVSNAIGGEIYGRVSEMNSYFSLRSENLALVEEIAGLNNRLSLYEQMRPDSLPDVVPDFFYMTARVVNSTIAHQENYFTINRGIADGINVKNAILSHDGAAVGYVLASSENYSVCMSMLNTQMRTSGKIKGTDFYGSVFWDGTSRNHISMSELSRYAPIHIGDTILTTNYSSIFPPGRIIGTVDRYSLAENGTYYNARIKLAANFGALGDVLVVKYNDAMERMELEDEYYNAYPNTGN